MSTDSDETELPTLVETTRNSALDETERRATDETTEPAEPVETWRVAGYDIGELLGRGGMGEVVAAVEDQLERTVAIKRLRGDRVTRDAVDRFLREAKIQARLDHPAIVPIHGLGYDTRGRPYFTMKRLSGVTLAQRITEGGPLQPLLRALVDVGFAIELAHTRGVIHRDLKPSNIMLGDYGEVYVLDWGVARVSRNDRTTVRAIDVDSVRGETGTGLVLGTPGYMAPEQLHGESIDPSADVYSLGAILFEILAGESFHPPGARAIASTLAELRGSPGQRRPDRAIAPELDELCVRALSTSPGDRPRARELAEAIQRYLDGDRDLERRLAISTECLAAARIALAESRRGDAVQLAGRALALAPESEEAAELVTSLIVEPPEVLPSAVVAALDDEARRLDQARSRSGIYAYLMAWIFVAVAPFDHVASWPWLGALVGWATVMAGSAWINARTGRVPAFVVVTGNLILVLVFSRLAGPLIMAPMLASGIMLALGSNRKIAPHSWIVLGWSVVAILLPIALEAMGVFEPTWRLTPDGVVSWSQIFDGHSAAHAITVVGGTVALAIVVGLYTLSATRGRRDAQRRLQIQAWHLRHLLPHHALAPRAVSS